MSQLIFLSNLGRGDLFDLHLHESKGGVAGLSPYNMGGRTVTRAFGIVEVFS